MNEKLSSDWTLFYKVIFPILWISGFGFGTLLLWFGSFDQSNPPPPDMKWSFLFAWITGSSFILWFSLRLKNVILKDNSLIVKDYFNEIIIPISSVNDVRESRFMNPKVIKLSLYPESKFGSKIVFIPKLKFYNPFGQHPIAKQLKQISNQPI
ncbi:MAG: hypothetical protein ACYC09_11220 [Bacteroidota bacterium]